jgi:hypothetical protein
VCPVGRLESRHSIVTSYPYSQTRISDRS